MNSGNFAAMKALPLAIALATLSACIVVPRPYRPPPPPPPPPVAVEPAPAPAYLTEAQAVDIAFRYARQMGLDVNRVHHVHMDGAGRWHVDLRGHGDKARLLIDGRDGRVLTAHMKD